MMAELVHVRFPGRGFLPLTGGAQREAPAMQNDAFPSTYRSWIGQKLQEGDEARQEINRHIMDVYERPLRVYFSGCRDQWLGDSAEIVASFFADRLARDGFLKDWQQSGLRLRRWLMNAFGFYLAEEYRRRRRSTAPQHIPMEMATSEESSETAMDRAFAASLIRKALMIAQRQCVAKGLGEHWGVFVRHYYDGEPYERVASEFGVDTARAAVMARTAAQRFRRALRDLFCRDGVSEVEIDQEIRSLLEVMPS